MCGVCRNSCRIFLVDFFYVKPANFGPPGEKVFSSTEEVLSYCLDNKFFLQESAPEEDNYSEEGSEEARLIEVLKNPREWV